MASCSSIMVSVCKLQKNSCRGREGGMWSPAPKPTQPPLVVAEAQGQTVHRAKRALGMGRESWVCGAIVSRSLAASTRVPPVPASLRSSICIP